MFTWPDGTVFKGQFFDDVKEGEGEIVYNDGTVCRGRWRADQPLEKEEPGLEHDEDCELFVPNNAKGFVLR